MADFPFTPGSARAVADPAKEAERLAEARKAAEVVPVRRGDLAALLAAAGLFMEALSEPPEELRRIVERYTGC